MKLACLSLFLVLWAAALPAHAATIYTADQLKLMIPLGHYPAEGPVAKRENQKMSWADCLTRSAEVVSSAVVSFPALRLVDTPKLRTTKIWTADASMTISCRVEGRMELSRSPYR
ncbi:hypothetical protein D0B54_05125 [Solimonas sp. K1W22B-7]|uniref:hypothetical protein n=1 Tax=Solimonas sp. K1W22B-7 TaxID=2303331 RepID=UPI000E332E0C|nr:hypothetical protein [Solimonas sp. K1W22B-7]AXQ28093.1 hypothetical protein D0B54_05125 [Solimonas sp. K1W22B-7]